MKTASVVIVDYGLGNLFNVERALQKVGASDTVISSDKDVIENAQALILPGVGAFGNGMNNLRERGLVPVIREFAESGRSILGVCLGMQLIMSESEEFGLHPGLDLISGRVRRLQPNGDAQFKIPHIGWNSLHECTSTASSGCPWECTELRDVEEGSFMYFVHSYVVVPDDPQVPIAVTQYGDDSFCSVLKKDNITGVQFHPELSSERGLNIYRNFVPGKQAVKP